MTFQGKEITLENLSPVFTPEQEAAKRRELEQQLYEVFRKYADKRVLWYTKVVTFRSDKIE